MGEDVGMVERVARAIYSAWALHEHCDVSWEMLVARSAEHRALAAAGGDAGYPNAVKWHDMAFSEARAAIEAMRGVEDGDFEIIDAQGDFRAGVGGPRAEALRDALHYAAIDGEPVQINEIIRIPLALAPKGRG